MIKSRKQQRVPSVLGLLDKETLSPTKWIEAKREPFHHISHKYFKQNKHEHSEVSLYTQTSLGNLGISHWKGVPTFDTAQFEVYICFSCLLS